MPRKNTLSYFGLNILAIALSCVLLVNIWNVSEQYQFLALIALLSIIIGYAVSSIALARLILKPEVNFGIRELASRSARDHFKTKVGRRTAFKVNLACDLIFILMLSLTTLIFVMLMKKYGLN